MRKRWKSLLRWLFVSILLVFVGRALVQQWPVIANYAWTIHLGILASSMILLAIGFIFISLIWIYIARACGDRITLYQGLWIYFCTTLSRYVPGKVWQIAGTAALGRESGFSGTRLGTSMVFLMLTNLQAGVLLSLVGAFFTVTGRKTHLSVPFIVGMIVVVFVIALMPLCTGLMFRLLRRWLRRDLPEVRLPIKTAIIVFLLIVLHWMGEGFAHFIFIRSFYSLAWIQWFDVVTVVAFANTIGFLAIFSPAGLGVRDGLLITLLPLIMPQAMAVTAAIGSRLWYTVTDVVTVALILVLLKWIRRYRAGVSLAQTRSTGILFYWRNNKIRHLAKRLLIDVVMVSRSLTLRRLGNLLLNWVEYILRRNVLRSLPPHMYIETTNYCNLQCPYCVNITRPANTKGVMSMNMFKHLVSQLERQVLSIRLYNQGDPLMDRNLIERLKVLRDRKIYTILSTNFSMPIDPVVMDRLVLTLFGHLVVCFESLREERYGKYRQGGSIAQVKKNIACFIETRRRHGGHLPFISFRIFLSKLNEDEVPDILSYFHSSGADNILFVPMYIDMSNLKAVAEWLPDNPKMRFNPVAVTDIICHELWNYPVVNYKGNLVPCCLISDYQDNFGDVSAMPFIDIWNGLKYREARHFFQRRRMVNPGTQANVCLRCQGILKTYRSIAADE